MTLVQKIKNGIESIAGGISTFTLFPDSEKYNVDSNPYLSEINKKRTCNQGSNSRDSDDCESN